MAKPKAEQTWSHTFMGMDPAPLNFGWGIVLLDEGRMDWDVLACGMIQNPIKNMPMNMGPAILAYADEVQSMIEMFRPTSAIIERFVNRGRVGANMTEKCNFMIGIATERFRSSHIPTTLPGSGPWKNKYNSVNGQSMAHAYTALRREIRKRLREMGCKEKTVKLWVERSPHMMDSCVMSLIYGSERANIPWRQLNLHHDMIAKRVGKRVERYVESERAKKLARKGKA